MIKKVEFKQDRSFALQVLAFRGEHVKHLPLQSTLRFYQCTDARGSNLPNHPFFTNLPQKKRILDGHITHFMNPIHRYDLNTIHLETNPITES
ncbi:hypothetical protein [Rossellomorea marisflavi]|uniref:hypothetical protein n=1 Tax=Rossellomorea marisflavi TaxID=189381 RepID=UPI00345A1BA2